MTATELIRARSILESKRLLTYTDNTVNEIAAELGYFDASYFAKLFKADTGTSPLAFRDAMSDKYRLK
jgi:AraC-like DNA-binding protein